MAFYLTPSAIGYLAQIILAGLISGYTLSLWRHQPRPQHLLWLTSCFVTLTAFIATLFLEALFLPSERLLAVFTQNSILALSIICFIQFGYRFPNRQAALKQESRIAGLLSLLYFLYETGFAIQRSYALANVEEVWINYLSNGLKYGGSPPQLLLGGERRGKYGRFWVKDNGAGLTAEEQARLFVPFERLDQIRVEGHGLGLSIVRRIIETLGGEVGVESKVGAGSLFYFTLPCVANPRYPVET